MTGTYRLARSNVGLGFPMGTADGNSGRMRHRWQRSIQREATISGIGFLTGADVDIRFLPAEANHGIAFRRIDVPGSALIPASLESLATRQRRTAVEHHGLSVEMIEHVMAALAGLQIDNCLVQLNAPEPPGCDGSAQAFVDCLLNAGTVEQSAERKRLTIQTPVGVAAEDGRSTIRAEPETPPALVVTYSLDYGPKSPIPVQEMTIEITRQNFIDELCFARTFVLEEEVAYLQAQGYGQRVTTQDLLVFSATGVIDNRLRTFDECVRHKILDCVGDLALLGCDVSGKIVADRSGHQLNHALMHRLQSLHANVPQGTEGKAA